MPSRERYNRIYSENERQFGAEPEQIVKDILKYRTEGTALELGAGQGRNALFLAEKGFTVTATDFSEVGIEAIRKSAAEKNLNVTVELADLRTFEAAGNFDVVACTFVLHHLSPEEAVRSINMMREHTEPGGLNAITSFTKEGDFYRDDLEKKGFYLDKDELRGLYNGWEILEYEETKVQARAKNPDGTHKTNVSARLLARKPSV